MTRDELEKLIEPVVRDSMLLPIAWREYHRIMAMLCQLKPHQIYLAQSAIPYPQTIVLAKDQKTIENVFVKKDSFYIYCVFFRDRWTFQGDDIGIEEIQA